MIVNEKEKKKRWVQLNPWSSGVCYLREGPSVGIFLQDEASPSLHIEWLEKKNKAISDYSLSGLHLCRWAK